jgi:hypothetical protein
MSEKVKEAVQWAETLQTENWGKAGYMEHLNTLIRVATSVPIRALEFYARQEQCISCGFSPATAKAALSAHPKEQPEVADLASELRLDTLYTEVSRLLDVTNANIKTLMSRAADGKTGGMYSDADKMFKSLEENLRPYLLELHHLKAAATTPRNAVDAEMVLTRLERILHKDSLTDNERVHDAKGAIRAFQAILNAGGA